MIASSEAIAMQIGTQFTAFTLLLAGAVVSSGRLPRPRLGSLQRSLVLVYGLEGLVRV
jgi:hypothetical protein